MKDLTILLILRDQWQYPDILGDLLALGHFVIPAYGAGDGYLMALRTKPDAIILDAHVFRINGHNLVTFLKQDARLTHMPVIIVTERYTVKECLNRYKSGVDFYFQNPTDPQVIIAHVRAILNTHQRLLPKFSRRETQMLDRNKNVFLNPPHGSVK